MKSLNDMYEIKDRKWAADLQEGLENYIMGLFDEEDDNGEPLETESGEPFCGCNTCEYREVLAYVVPRVLMAEKENKVGLVYS